MINVGCLWHGGYCRMKCKYGEMLFQGCGYETCCRPKPKTTKSSKSAAVHYVPSVGILQMSSLFFLRKMWNVMY